MKRLFCSILILLALAPAGFSAERAPAIAAFENWSFKGFGWNSTAPLVSVGPGAKADDPHVSIKDPSFVFHDGMWHLFTTVRMKSGRVDMEYSTFKDWKDAEGVNRYVLYLHDQYNCAPQIFYFTPHKKWYFVYQRADTNSPVKFGPCFSTSTNIANPRAWTKPELMITRVAPSQRWIDFWIICTDEKAYMFYTSNDGNMWRRETAKSKFPFDWSEPMLALKGDIFEASHTYKIRGAAQFLTVIEAQGKGRRYYKAYTAKRLDGYWFPVAASLEKPFASPSNVHQDNPWTTNFSHGELVRASIDEYMEIDPTNLKFIYQGASDEEYRDKPYGQIPWRLGMLEEAN